MRNAYAGRSSGSSLPRMRETASRRSARVAGGSSGSGERSGAARDATRIMRRMAVGREGVSPVSGTGLMAAQVSMTSTSREYSQTVVLLTTGTVSRSPCGPAAPRDRVVEALRCVDGPRQVKLARSLDGVEDGAYRAEMDAVVAEIRVPRADILGDFRGGRDLGEDVVEVRNGGRELHQGRKLRISRESCHPFHRKVATHFG